MSRYDAAIHFQEESHMDCFNAPHFFLKTNLQAHQTIEDKLCRVHVWNPEESFDMVDSRYHPIVSGDQLVVAHSWQELCSVPSKDDFVEVTSYA